MLLSEARPRPYRQPESERRFNQEETDKKAFDELRDHAVWTKNYGQDFINRYKHAFNNGKDGFEYERDYIQDDPEVRKLLDMMCVEVDKQIKPIIADVSKKLMNLKVLVSQRISDFYKK